ncbi:tryptophan synthase subunit alpha [Cohnella sp. AR92]|uniref:tryptophan synthase subunit alpha n=1 Tax=Cohnella sp. AR92 TaxID=648716 RepID=UPI000F8E6ED1|nr:tryptophan synthase subunit alpha [Cohnella sp. AR92]RUS48185.1 tryptophan synthase subunit alpha [Cohnella sp. AR92]
MSEIGTNLIDAVFAELKEKGETALIPFMTMGDPDLGTSIRLIQAAEAAGASMIELGVPYSDPLADGPVIQRASERALRNRISLLDCMEIASESRRQGVKMPFILFTYFNPVLQLGLENFFNLMQEHDFSGAIIPDLPMEEDEQVRALAERSGIHLIPLVAPTSEARVEKIAARARGFVYCVSSLGVTGVRSSFHAGLDSFLATVRQAASVPICVGFGVSTREQAEQLSEKCDGVIVGSAIVRKVEEELQLLQSAEETSREKGLTAVQDFIAALKPRSVRA